MRLLLILLISITTFPAMAQNTQPISVSLAECSVIFKVLRVTAAQRGKTQEQLDKLRKGSEIFLDTARTEAEKEQQPEGFIDDELPRLTDKWDNRWLSASDTTLLANMSENMEWVQYCGKLGKHKGILPIK